MKILIINGSPAGDDSITLQTLLYIQKHFPGHAWTRLNVTQRLHALERDFAPVAEALREAELIIFSYPVYTFLVPAQLHRFLELWKAAGIDLAGKWATQLSTSTPRPTPSSGTTAQTCICAIPRASPRTWRTC